VCAALCIAKYCCMASCVHTNLGLVNQGLAGELGSDWELSHMIHLFSGSSPLSEAILKLPSYVEDAGML
jgi:hypothetical protein